jgi:hypothetical protein
MGTAGGGGESLGKASLQAQQHPFPRLPGHFLCGRNGGSQQPASALPLASPRPGQPEGKVRRRSTALRILPNTLLICTWLVQVWVFTGEKGMAHARPEALALLTSPGICSRHLEDSWQE